MHAVLNLSSPPLRRCRGTALHMRHGDGALQPPVFCACNNFTKSKESASPPPPCWHLQHRHRPLQICKLSCRHVSSSIPNTCCSVAPCTVSTYGPSICDAAHTPLHPPLTPLTPHVHAPVDQAWLVLLHTGCSSALQLAARQHSAEARRAVHGPDLATWPTVNRLCPGPLLVCSFSTRPSPALRAPGTGTPVPAPPPPSASPEGGCCGK